MEELIKNEVKRYKIKKDKPHFANDGEALLIFFYILVPMAIIYIVLKKHNLI